MPRLTEKQSLFSKYMFTPGSESFGNGVKSARRAGYKGDINQLGQRAHELVNNSKIKAEKQQIQAENEEKIEIDRDYCIEKTKAILESSKAERTKLIALSLLGDFVGAKRDNAPNGEKEQARIDRMSAEERAFRAAWQRERCKQEAKTIPIRSA